MKLQAFCSLWTNGYDLEAGLRVCAEGPFDGIEGPVPVGPRERDAFRRTLRDSGLPLIAEVVTGGDYVPVYHDAGRHLADYRSAIENSAELEPLFFNVLAGCDCWSLAESVEFLGTALELAAELGVVVSFETHRGRPTFTPWATRDLLLQLPDLLLTCDFSHWCCVSERLVLDGEAPILDLCAARARHIHARVGYDQGPQVPHPAAPEYARELEAHERWWDAVWSAQELAGFESTTLGAEFGPDGYLQKAPFSGRPVASLEEVNAWIAAREAERFARRRGPDVVA